MRSKPFTTDTDTFCDYFGVCDSEKRKLKRIIGPFITIDEDTILEIVQNKLDILSFMEDMWGDLLRDEWYRISPDYADCENCPWEKTTTYCGNEVPYSLCLMEEILQDEARYAVACSYILDFFNWLRK